MDNIQQKKPENPSKIKQVAEGALYFASAFALALLIQNFIARPFIVNGQSMDPTFKNRDYLIVDKVSYYFNEPRRGDVIVFRAPPEPDKFFIKRIIGLPGETVKIRSGKITITNNENPDGFVLDDSFVFYPTEGNMTVEVEEGHYFVMGDNRTGSFDSRSWGTLPKKNIRGRALLRLLPIKKIGIMPGAVNFEK